MFKDLTQIRNTFGLGAGCVSYSSIHKKACGVGAGWVRTDILDFQTTKHGASHYVGIIVSEYDKFDNEAISGAGLGHHYFYNGISKSGTNVGFTLVAGTKMTE